MSYLVSCSTHIQTVDKTNRLEFVRVISILQPQLLFVIKNLLPWPQGYETCFMLISAEHEILDAQK